MKRQPEQPAFEPAKFSTALLGIMDVMSQVAEQAQGYRARLEELGFSPTAAEMMAVDFHRSMLRMVLPGPVMS